MAQALRSRLREKTSAPTRLAMRAAPLIHPHHFRRRHHAAAIMVVVVLAVLSFQVFPGRDVTVIKDGAAYRVSSLFDPASDALAAAAVSLEPGDRVLAGNEGSHTSVAVQRARPVIIDVDGQSLELRSLAGTVGGVLAESGVTLKPGDEVLLDGQAATTRSSLAAASYTSRRSKPISNEVAAVDPTPLRLTVVRARPVEVIVDTHQVELSSAASTVAGVLQHMGMSVREGDLVRPGLDTPVTAGLTIRLARARSVNLRLDGKHEVLYTQARTVQDVLDILGVSPGPDDLLSPSRETRIIDGMNIVIGRTRVVDEVMDENLPAPVVFETDSSLPNGQVRVVPGTPGLKQTTYAVTYKNGVETARTLTRAGVARAAVPTRVITGTSGSGGAQMLDVPGYSGPFSRKMTVRTTWYNATHGAWAREDPNYGLTRSGVMLDYGICAVDPNVIPLGTRFYVPGYGVCLAADTGGLVRGNHVDLGFPEEAGWNPWNTQTLDIYILG